MPHTFDLARLNEVFDELENEDRLTKWERGFVDSVQAQWQENGKLTDPQLECLEKIWIRL